MRLHDLSPEKGSTKNRKRLGRGVASGQGKTAGRGTKGFKSRSGGSVRKGFEGGQMPLHRRIPKRGFTNIFRKNYACVNVKKLSIFESGQVVDEKALEKAGLIKGQRDGVKILGDGELNNPLTIKVNSVSKSARQKIESAGGNIEVI